ncbi:protein-glutamate methylesterase/protein-glutamine glutaminase [Paenibacillus woosongensis]|uniref:Protein-glutamate methylesterase/protein-glutamine glutaminase n=1 Tax=Paenibacillus woosongensis TaxID=307580 RepID=A0A7X2Z145_9BACL|nr:chemotaxis response regulator protein-glutamate methylesterase [Paenibacillus woosongensis]MUG45577.1 chemotaxis-specific protein-glutamate methyltransferase CheB [Paenibacillus woosongensis]
MPYRIMVVDDSAFMRKIVSDLIEQDPDFQVIGTARNGREAIEQIGLLSPDLVTMDVEMPELNGLDALKIIMERQPLPVIMLSGINEQGMRETIMALELGAFDFIRKPSASTSSHDIRQVKLELHEQIRTAMQMKERKAARESGLHTQAELHSLRPASSAKTTHSADTGAGRASSKPKPERMIIRGMEHHASATAKEQIPKSAAAKLERDAWTGARSDQDRSRKIGAETVSKPGKANRTDPEIVSRSSPAAQDQGTEKLLAQKDKAPVQGTGPKEAAGAKYPAQKHTKTDFTDIVAIGTSTGGPKALKAVLEKIPRNFPAPIVIVQHMPPNFTKSLAQRLDSLSQLRVVEAEEGMKLLPGTAYIAPGGFHMNVVYGSDGYKITLNSQQQRNGHRPSVEVLYESLLPLTTLKRHIVLLTGMGSDGARAMKKLYEAGVTSTIAESEETCVVYGMPRSAIELHCVSHVLPLQEIGPKLVQVVK